MPGEHKVHHHAQGKNIGGCTRLLAFDQFRCGVCGGAHNLTGERLVVAARQPEVCQFYRFGHIQQNIAGFNIAVYQPSRMSLRQSLHYRQQNLQGFPHREGTALPQQLA